MNHDTAIETQAAERYMLAEMSEAERDSFEEHYFGCFACADDIQSIELFLASGKEVMRKRRRVPVPPPIPQPTFWTKVAPLAVAASLIPVGISTQQFAENQKLRREVQQIGGIPEQVEISSAERSSTDPPIRVSAHRTVLFTLEIDTEKIAGDRLYGSYRAVVLGPGDSIIQTATIPAELTADPVPVVVRPLPAGSYKMVIEGVRKDGNRPEITETHPFVVSGS